MLRRSNLARRQPSPAAHRLRYHDLLVLVLAHKRQHLLVGRFEPADAAAPKERQQPERRDAQLLQIVELLGQASEVADAIAIAVAEGAYMQFVDDRVFVPVDNSSGGRRAAQPTGLSAW
ncbi:MAG: hypothetical protein OHK0022_08540 [Roseiflexaceae bacterium]